MRRMLAFISIFLLLTSSLAASTAPQRKNTRNAKTADIRAKAKKQTTLSGPRLQTNGDKPARLVQTGLKKLATKKKQKKLLPKHHALTTPVEVGTKTRAALSKTTRQNNLVAPLANLENAALPAIPVDTPGDQVVITSDFQSQSNSGGSVIALRDSNGDGIADQQAIMADNAVSPGDAITKIVASQLLFGRYFALTESSELIQLDDVDGDYVADGVLALGDVISDTGLGIGLATSILDDGTEAVYLLTIEPGRDDIFYSADDFCAVVGFFDRDGDDEFDSLSDFLETNDGFTSFGGFTTGVETAMLFNLSEFDNSGRVLSGAIYSYYDFDGDGIYDDFADNQNDGIFADATNDDLRPAVATEMVTAGTDYYVIAPLVALRLANNDDIAVYSDFNASQIADDAPFIFANIPSLSGFSSDLGGLAISFNGKRVAAARNATSNGSVQTSRLLLMNDSNLDQQADSSASQFFDNNVRGLAGTAFGNVDLLGAQPVIIFPRLKPIGKFVLDAIGAHITTGAVLLVDNQQFAMKLNAVGTKWVVTATTRSSPGGITISQALSSGRHTLIVKNPTGQQSLPVVVQVN